MFAWIYFASHFNAIAIDSKIALKFVLSYYHFIHVILIFVSSEKK